MRRSSDGCSGSARSPTLTGRPTGEVREVLGRLRVKELVVRTNRPSFSDESSSRSATT